MDGMGWDGMGWDGMGWDGMGWDGMGWDGMDGWMKRKKKITDKKIRIQAIHLGEIIFELLGTRGKRWPVEALCNINIQMKGNNIT